MPEFDTNEKRDKKVNKTKGEELHKYHRKRLKEKFLEYGADALEEHEFLELMLYYSIPRKDTNEIAHRLMNEFGRLSDILSADIENLTRIEGITEHTAIMLKVMNACVGKCINDVNNIANTMLTPKNINIYIKNLFYGQTNETAYAVLLDKDCIVKKVKKLSVGTVNATPIYPREVVKLAVNERYPYMLLAHNHPNGNAVPSQNDFNITKTIELALSFVEVRLVDHVIVSGEQVVSLAKQYDFMEK